MQFKKNKSCLIYVVRTNQFFPVGWKRKKIFAPLFRRRSSNNNIGVYKAAWCFHTCFIARTIPPRHFLWSLALISPTRSGTFSCSHLLLEKVSRFVKGGLVASFYLCLMSLITCSSPLISSPAWRGFFVCTLTLFSGLVQADKMAPKQRMNVANQQFSKNVNARGNTPKSLVSLTAELSDFLLSETARQQISRGALVDWLVCLRGLRIG